MPSWKKSTWRRSVQRAAPGSSWEKIVVQVSPSFEPSIRQMRGSRLGSSFAEETVKCVSRYAIPCVAVKSAPTISGKTVPQHHLSFPGPSLLSKTLNAA
ncbi:MAG: hypothetical protein ACUVYA_12890 [Planctomycetota bacterium]